MPQNRNFSWHDGWLSDQLDQLAGATKDSEVMNLTLRASLEKLCSIGRGNRHLRMQGAYMYKSCPILFCQLINTITFISDRKINTEYQL